MDWEDFEHLVREIFGKEFSSGGGRSEEVTQASRDGGVERESRSIPIRSVGARSLSKQSATRIRLVWLPFEISMEPF